MIKLFTMESLFPNSLVRGKVHSQDSLPDGDDYFYVGAKKDGNGVMTKCGYDENLISKGNCIIFICNGEGSVGYSLYMDRDFYASGDLILGYNEHLNKYVAMYLIGLLDRERPKYSFGRKYGTHVPSTTIPLPATEDGKPDWNYIENYVRQTLIPQMPTKAKAFWTDTYDFSALNNEHIILNIVDWKHFSVDEIFERFEPTKGTTTDSLLPGKEIPYIAAKHKNNGLDMMCSYEGNEDFISEGNCIVFIQIGAGSAGYALYQGYDFIGMQGKTICGYNSQMNKYSGLFLATILSKERPKFSFGRSWTGTRLYNTKILLPAISNSDGSYSPDWEYMEKYIKSLPFSQNI